MSIAVEQSAAHPRVRHGGCDRARLSDRAAKLRKQEIQYIPNPDFSASLLHQGDLGFEAIRSQQARLRDDHDDVRDATFHGLGDFELLDPSQEQALFREMNLVKFCAEQLRSRLEHEAVDLALVEEIEGLIQHAQEIRNFLVRSNMRLVMSIVKKFVSPQNSFDDLLSDGTIVLMNAIDKFDFSRGFRFSTYAYRSIVRDTYRNVKTSRNDPTCVGDAEWTLEQSDDRSSALNDQAWSNLRELATTFLTQLDRRERFIVRSRYALGSHRQVRTFQYLADKLGVSKERARQIERRAVMKLQKMASGLDLDVFCHNRNA